MPLEIDDLIQRGAPQQMEQLPAPTGPGERLNLDGPLTQALLTRQVQEPRQPAPMKELSPTIMALLGSAVDGASTYNFMRNDSGNEDNALFAGQSPLMTGLSAAGTGLAGIGISKLLGKKFPKLANVLLANQAGQQLGMGVKNFSRTVNGESSPTTINRGIIQAMKPDRFMK